MTDPFAGRTIWITGASSGIGRALALELDRRGAHLVLSARRQVELEALSARLTNPALVLPFDVAEPDRFADAAQAALAWRDGIDTLVNNAGISQRSLVVDTDFAVYRRVMEVDFFAPVRLTQLVLPHMIARGGGRIVVTGSVAGKLGVPLRSGYSAAKHALLGWFDALRAEVETAHAIGVTVVLPGSVRTEIASNALDAAGARRGRSDENVANGMSAEDVAHRIVEGVAAGEREILIAEGAEAQAVGLRAGNADMLFALTAAEGARLAEARREAGDNWSPEPARVR